MHLGRAPHLVRQIAILALTPMAAFCQYYVATNGSDTNPGTLSQPFATINKAAGVVAPGGMVYIRGGTYYQTVSISRSGTAAARITIAGYPGETAIIDGKDTLPTGNWGTLFNVSGSYVTVQDLTVQNSNWMGVVIQGSYVTVSNIKSYRHHENGILVTGGSNDVVENSEVYYNCRHNEFGQNRAIDWASGLTAARGGVHHATLRGNKVWNNWGEGFSTYESTYITMEDNVVWDNWATNVYLSDTQYAMFRRNLVYRTANNVVAGYSGSEIGIEMGDEVYNPRSSDNTIINNFVMGARRNLYWWHNNQTDGLINDVIANNTFVNSTYYGGFAIGSGGTHSNTIIKNNIVLQEDSLPPVVLESYAGITFSNNLWSKAPPAAASSASDIIDNPQLSRAGSTAAGSLSPDYFKLLAGSPAIDRAAVLSQISEDFFKMPRGTSPDIGGHEFGSGGDRTAPTTPTNLAAVTDSQSEVSLSWSPSTDNIAVGGYRIYRNGTQTGTSTTVTYKDTGLLASTSYSYTVAAYDAAGNVSAQSAAASATTFAASDTTPPSPPSGVAATVASSSQINLSWTASTDNVGVVGYRVFRNASLAGTTSTAAYQDTGLTASTTYSYTVQAYDAAGNSSGQSAVVTSTTQAPPPVASGPIAITITSPTGSTVARGTRVTLGATAQGVTPVSIAWSVDGVSIAGTTTQTATGATSTAVWSVGNGRGWHTITATATDAAGRTVTSNLRVRAQ